MEKNQNEAKAITAADLKGTRIKATPNQKPVIVEKLIKLKLKPRIYDGTDNYDCIYIDTDGAFFDGLFNYGIEEEHREIHYADLFPEAEPITPEALERELKGILQIMANEVNMVSGAMPKDCELIAENILHELKMAGLTSFAS